MESTWTITRVLEPVVSGLVTKETVTPVGTLVAERITAPLKPAKAVALRLVVPELKPEAGTSSVSVFGSALSVKPPFSTRLKVVLRVMPPLMPLTVTVVLPWVAVEATLRDMVLVVEVGLGAKLVRVTPAGRPEIDKLAEPANPLRAFTVMVPAALMFGEAGAGMLAVMEAGAVRLKSVTVTLRGVV